MDNFWGMDVIGTDNVDTSDWDVSNSFDSLASPLPSGPWLDPNAGSGQYAGYNFSTYSVERTSEVIVDSHQDRESHGCPPVFGYYTYKTWITKAAGRTQYYTNSVKADYPIDIQFMGLSDGEVTVNSTGNNGAAGNVWLKGNITNQTGTVNITSTNGAINPVGNVLITGEGVNLNAETGIASASVLKTNLVNGGVLSAVTTTGNVKLK
ncbi:MAG: hypothetical protein FD127_4239, partial [Acidimicrobiaceae bacterium]